MDARPIGVFDSGIGGITILKELYEEMPHEHFVYYADTARLPYGVRSDREIIALMKEALVFFRKKDIKLLVVACNTAWTVAGSFLEEMSDFPCIGVVDSATYLIRHTKDIHRLGILATETTIKSGVHEQRIEQLGRSIEVRSLACPMFVSIVEEGWNDSDLSDMIVQKYLSAMKGSVDSVLLASTHFTVLKDQIQNFLGDEVILIDPSKEVARYTSKILKERALETDRSERGTIAFFVSDKPEKFKLVAGSILPVDDVQLVESENTRV